MVTNLTAIDCELCNSAGEDIVWRDSFARVIRVHDEMQPGFCRVIMERHVKEMSDLKIEERDKLMRIVFSVEEVARAVLAPDKINLASFGNVVPHVHWHIIPRWRDDAHFPNPIWAPATSAGASRDIHAARHATARSDLFANRIREALS